MLEYVRQRSKGQMVGIGTSLGGNVLMKVQAEMKDFPLKVLIFLNQPFDVWKARNMIIGSIYERFLLNDLILPYGSTLEDQRKFIEYMKPKFGITQQVFKVTKWEDFDKEFTLKAHPHYASV